MGWRGPVTHRQFTTWMIWLDQQWDQPTKLEWHILQLTAEVIRTTVKPEYRHQIKMSDLKIPFKTSLTPFSPPEKATPQQRKVASQIAKASWLSVVGPIQENTNVCRTGTGTAGSADRR